MTTKRQGGGRPGSSHGERDRGGARVATNRTASDWNGSCGPVWYGGGKLARDLMLTAARNLWDGNDPAAALPAWTVTSSPERSDSSAESVWPRAQQALSACTEQVRAIPLGEHAQWQAVTREISEIRPD